MGIQIMASVWKRWKFVIPVPKMIPPAVHLVRLSFHHEICLNSLLKFKLLLDIFLNIHWMDLLRHLQLLWRGWDVDVDVLKSLSIRISHFCIGFVISKEDILLKFSYTNVWYLCIIVYWIKKNICLFSLLMKFKKCFAFYVLFSTFKTCTLSYL